VAVGTALRYLMLAAKIKTDCERLEDDLRIVSQTVSVTHHYF